MQCATIVSSERLLCESCVAPTESSPYRQFEPLGQAVSGCAGGMDYDSDG